MADSLIVSSLSGFTRAEHPFEWMRMPFMLVNDQVTWSIATDGAWLVAVRGKSSFPNLLREDDKVQSIRRCLSFEPNGSAIQVKIDTLRTWAGEAPLTYSFSREGDTPDGLVLGVPLDRRRLAWILQRTPFPELTLWNTTADLGLNSIGLRFKSQWLAILAGIRSEDPADEAPLPRFPERQIDMLDELPQE